MGRQSILWVTRSYSSCKLTRICSYRFYLIVFFWKARCSSCLCYKYKLSKSCWSFSLFNITSLMAGCMCNTEMISIKFCFRRILINRTFEVKTKNNFIYLAFVHTCKFGRNFEEKSVAFFWWILEKRLAGAFKHGALIRWQKGRGLARRNTAPLWCHPWRHYPLLQGFLLKYNKFTTNIFQLWHLHLLWISNQSFNDMFKLIYYHYDLNNSISYMMWTCEALKSLIF